VRFQAHARALLDEHALEHCRDRIGATEYALEPRAAASVAEDDGEVAGTRVVETLPVEQDGRRGLEVRLADDELAAPRDLDDGGR
jgi:hypothetical protein